MAGSIDVHNYIDDNGQVYNFRGDVGNMASTDTPRGVDTAAQIAGRYLQVSATVPIQMRYGIFVSRDNPAITRKAVIGDPASAAWLTQVVFNFDIDGVASVFDCTAKVGEVRRFLPFVDTGIVEGAAV